MPEIEDGSPAQMILFTILFALLLLGSKLLGLIFALLNAATKAVERYAQ